LQPIRRYGFDASIVFADILLIPYGLGRRSGLKKAKGRSWIRWRLKISVAVCRKSGPRVLSPSAKPSQSRAGLPDTCSLIGFCGIALDGGHLYDRGRRLEGPVQGPHPGLEPSGRFDALMDLLAEASAQYLKAQADAGAECAEAV
jgi:uroporphyrinogen decarboxylase